MPPFYYAISLLHIACVRINILTHPNRKPIVALGSSVRVIPLASIWGPSLGGNGNSVS